MNLGTRLTRSLSAAVLLAALVAAPASAQDHGAADAPATALRVALDRALGEHAFLLGEVIRSGTAGAADFEAATAALEANTADVVGAIEDVYGPEAAAAFEQQWANHVAYIVDYGRALVEDNADAAELATTQLERYVADFSGFLAEALPALPPDAVQGLIGEHVQQLEHVASFEEGDFGGAYGAIRETYAHMFDVGDALATGIVSLYPDRFTGRDVAFSPATDLRVTLDRLLGEHTYLAAGLMRAALRDASDLTSVVGAVRANSDELTAAIAAIYGAEAGTAFAELWGRHVDAYGAYVVALAAEDVAAADAALEDLDAYRTDFSGYLTTANPNLSSSGFEAMIGEHTEDLVLLADAYAADDYAGSYRIGREAYAHAGALAASLAGAIADQFPQLFPDTAMPEPTEARPAAAWAAAVAVAVIALLVAARTRGAVRRRSVT